MLKYFLLIITFFLNNSQAYSVEKDVVVLFNDPSSAKLKAIDQLYSKTLNADNNNKSKGLELLKIGNDYWNNEKLEKFKRTNIEAFKVFVKLSDNHGIGKVYENLGDYYSHWNIKKNDSALYFYELSKRYYKDSQFDNYHNVNFKMAINYLKSEDYLKCRILLDRVLRYYLSVNNSNMVAQVFGIKGHVYAVTKEYYKAISNYEKALNFENNQVVRANYYNNLARIYLTLDNVNAAGNFLADAKQVKNIDKYDGLLSSLLIENYAYFLEKTNTDSTLVIKEYKKAVRNYDSLNYDRDHIRLMLSNYYKKLGSHAKSLMMLEEAYEYAEDIKMKEQILSEILKFNKFDRKYVDDYLIIRSNIIEEDHKAKIKVFEEISENNAFNEISTDKSKEIDIFRIILILGITISLIFVLLYFNNKKKHQNIINERDRSASLRNLLLEDQNKIRTGIDLVKKEISRELHDGVVNELMGLRFTVKDKLNNGVYDIDTVLSNIKEIENKIRNVSHDIRNWDLEYNQFVDVLNNIIKTYSFNSDIEWEFEIGPGDWDSIPVYYKLNIYRIVQELTANTIKHAHATKVQLETFFVGLGEVSLFYVDNGVGISSLNTSGIGLRNIEERLIEMNSDYKIESFKNGGYKLNAKILIDYNYD